MYKYIYNWTLLSINIIILHLFHQLKGNKEGVQKNNQKSYKLNNLKLI